MHQIYNTRGVCAQRIEFDLHDGKIYNVTFTGGCNGNLKAISKLIEGIGRRPRRGDAQGQSLRLQKHILCRSACHRHRAGKTSAIGGFHGKDWD